MSCCCSLAGEQADVMQWQLEAAKLLWAQGQSSMAVSCTSGVPLWRANASHHCHMLSR